MSTPNILAVAAIPAVSAVQGPSEDPVAPWPPGTLLRLLQAADGVWELQSLDDALSQASAPASGSAGVAMPLPEPPLADLQPGEVLVLRVTQVDEARGAVPRIELEIVDRQIPPRMTMAVSIDDELAEDWLPAMQAPVLPWGPASSSPVHAGPWPLPLPDSRLLEVPLALAAPATTQAAGNEAPSGRPAQDWARASLPLLMRGLAPAEPFDHSLWVHARSLSDWLGSGQDGLRRWPAPAGEAPDAAPSLSVLWAWRGQVVGLELAGRPSGLALDIAAASTLALAALHRAWPSLSMSLARSGWRVRKLHFRRRYLRLPSQHAAVTVDPDLLWAAGEILCSL